MPASTDSTPSTADAFAHLESLEEDLLSAAGAMLKRRPVQIAVAAGALYALANDGTIWLSPYVDAEDGWKQVQALPQED